MGASLAACFIRFGFRLAAGIACGKVSRAPPCTRKGRRPLTRIDTRLFRTKIPVEQYARSLFPEAPSALRFVDDFRKNSIINNNSSLGGNVDNLEILLFRLPFFPFVKRACPVSGFGFFLWITRTFFVDKIVNKLWISGYFFVN